MSHYDVAVLWFRNGLRFHDNECLRDACAQSKTLIPLYVIDPDAPFCQTAGRRAGTIRANFILESLRDVDGKFRNHKSQLIVIVGKQDAVIPQVMSMFNSDALFYEKEPAAPIREADSRVLQALRKQSEKDGKEFKVVPYETHTLHPMEHYLANCQGNVAPGTYGAFTKIFQKMKVQPEVPDVKQVPPFPTNVVSELTERYGDDFGIPTLAKLGYENADEDLKNRGRGGFDFKGGETEGLLRLEKMMNRSQWVATFEKPNTIPNNAQCPDTTALSPYIKHGCLSPHRFYRELSKVYAKYNPKELSKPPVSLHGQLMWREYNYLMGYSTPNFDKMVDNPIARQVPWDDDPELLSAWKSSRTGYPFIDAIMTQLRETGWIHHLARHAVACFLTRGDLWQSWEQGAAVFEEYLIDADWSINNFNWQWLSCTAHFYQYFRCYSPVSFGKKTDPNGDYIRKWLPQFKDMPAKYIYEPWEAPLALQEKCGVIIGVDYPNPIVDHKTTSKANMGRMKEAYDAQKAGEPIPSKRQRTQ